MYNEQDCYSGKYVFFFLGLFVTTNIVRFFAQPFTTHIVDRFFSDSRVMCMSDEIERISSFSTNDILMIVI